MALTAALVAPYFIDWTSYRAGFEREASRILGREVTVRGSASARLLPFPSVTFTDVVVAGVAPGEPAMTVQTFSMDAELAPFMRGDIHIFDMRLVRPSVLIGIGEDGALDWAVRPSVPVGAQHVSLEKLTITEGQVAVRHAGSGRTHTLTEINADVSARALSGPWRLDGTLRLDGMRTALTLSTGMVDDTGAMRLRLRAEPERYPFVLETDGSARIEGTRARYAGQFKLNASTGAERLRTGDGSTFALGGQRERAPPAYRLSGAFDFDHAALKVPEFRFETGPLDDPYTADGMAELTLGTEPRFLIRADGAQFRFGDGAGEAGAGAALDRRLAALREFLLDMPRPAIPGRIEVNLPAIVAGDTTVRDVRVHAEPSQAGWTVGSLAATLPGRTTLEARGELDVGDRLGFDGSLLLAVGQPSGFAAWLSRDVDDAIRRLPAAGFSADVRLTEERQSFRNLELRLGSATFAGEIDSRTPAGAMPSMVLRLDGDRLDVEGMAAFASLFVSDSGRTRLADRDLEFEISAGPVIAAGLSADTLDTALRLKQGKLEIDRLAIGGLEGVNISATGSVDGLGDAPSGDIDAALIAADLQPLLAALAARFPDNRLATEAARRAGLYPGLLEDASIRIVARSGGGDGIALSATGEAGGSALSLDLTAPSLDLAALRSSPISLDVSVRNEDAGAVYALMGLPALPIGFAGAAETRLTISGAIDDAANARLIVSGDGLRLSYEGEGALRQDGLTAAGRVELDSDDLEPWLATAGVALPGMGPGLPMQLAAQLDLDGGLLVLSGLDGEVAGSRIEGDLNVQMREGLPHLTGAVSLDTFDLRPVAELAAGAPALLGNGEGWPSAPFTHAVSTPLTTDVELDVSRLRLGTLGDASDARATLRVNRDGVSLPRIEGRIHGGTASGIVDFRNDGGTGLLSAQLRLADAQIARLIGDAGLSGTVDLTAALTSSGKSVDGIVAALAGSGTAHARFLAVSGVNPDALPALIERADALGLDVDAAATAAFAPELVRDGTLRAERTDMAFTVASGAVRVPPLRIEAQGAALAAEMRADLRAGTVGVEATLTYDAGTEALVGSEPSVRFSANGPLDAVDVAVDTEPLARFLTQRALEREQQRVEAMQAALLERQRHRREIRYYAALAGEREKVAEEERRAAEEAERLRLEAEEAERQRLPDESRRQPETRPPAAGDGERQSRDDAGAPDIFSPRNLLSVDQLMQSIGRGR